MKRMIALVGEPATGKTTCMREFMSELADDWEEGKLSSAPEFKLVQGAISRSTGAMVLGLYQTAKRAEFGGTDMLSMAVMPQVLQWLAYQSPALVIFEGDRLGSANFFEQVQAMGYELVILYLTADREVVASRHVDRGDEQSDSFINGRKTKIAKITTNFDLMDSVEEYPNNTPSDKASIVQRMLEAARALNSQEV